MGPSIRRGAPSVATVLGVALVVVGCASQPVPGWREGRLAPGAESIANRTRRLIMLTKFEPTTLTARVTSGGEPQLRTALFTAGLAYTDEQDIDHPQLALALPELNTDSWR